MSLTLEEIATGTDHERVVFCRDPEAGYRAVIAIHSSVAGPAVGGTRYWTYAGEEEAVADALRLSRGMTFKSIMAGLPMGGGKSVILRDPRDPVDTADRAALFRAHGQAIERLGGLYTAGEDVGTSRRTWRRSARRPGTSPASSTILPLTPPKAWSAR